MCARPWREAAVKRVCPDLNAQEVAMTTWGYATLGWDLEPHTWVGEGSRSLREHLEHLCFRAEHNKKSFQLDVSSWIDLF